MRACSVVLAAAFLITGAPAMAQTTLSTTSADWIVQGGPTAGGFADHVAIAGDIDGDGYDDVMIGEPRHDGAYTDSGRVLFYRGSGGGPETTPAWTLEGNQPGVPLDLAFPAGDVNGDGFADVVALFELASLPFRADLTLYLGSAAGPVPSSWTVSGWSTRTGDINGDGFDDLAVLADRDVLVFYGSSAGLPPEPGTTLSVPSVLTYPLLDAAFEDLNGDGFDDLALTWRYCARECQYTIAELSVYPGSANGIATQPKRRLSFKVRYKSPVPHLTSAGDVNGDGFGDLAIPVDTDIASLSGLDELYWLAGSNSGLRTSLTLVESSSAESYGDYVNGAGDINGDGFADLLVPGDEELTSPLRVYTGGPGGYASTPALIIEAGPGDRRQGAINAGDGDVNGDGLDDFIVGSSLYYDGQQIVGRVYLFLGRTTF